MARLSPRAVTSANVESNFEFFPTFLAKLVPIGHLEGFQIYYYVSLSNHIISHFVVNQCHDHIFCLVYVI